MAAIALGVMAALSSLAAHAQQEQAPVAAPAASAAASAPAAAGVPSGIVNSPALPTITVKARSESPTGPVNGYKARRATTATKTDTPLKDTPLSVTVLTRDLIVDQGATNIQDALNYAAGVRPDAYGLDSRTDSIRVRGGYPDEYLDGLRKNFDWYTSNARTEPFTLERIELLRGPAAMLYGQGTVGGVINMVSKRPQAEAQGEIGVQLGTWNRKQVQADVTGPLTASGEWLYRLIAVGRDADTQVDHVRDDRALIAPSLTWKPSAATALTLQLLSQRDRTGSTSQFFPWAGTVAPNPNGQIPTHRFIGDPDWDRYDTDRDFIGYLFEHKFSEALMLRQNLRYTKTDVDYRSLYGDSFSTPGGWDADPVGQRLLGRYAYGNINRTKLFTVDQNLFAKFATGPVQHELLAGLDAAHYKKSSSSAFEDSSTVPLIDVYNPVYPAYTPPAFGPAAKSTQTQVGLYLQDQLRFARDWLVTFGLRHDRARNVTEGGGVGGVDDAQNHKATTKRVGLLYSAPLGVSPYVSYSESFTPQANRGSTTFKPLTGKQWEVGVKAEPTDKLKLNVAAFDVREVNQIQEPTPGTFNQLGEIKATGFEVDLTAAFSRSFDLIASYTYTDLDVKLEQMPRNQANVRGKWKLTTLGVDGLSLGAGVRYLSDYRDGAAPTVPSLALLDAMIAWESTHWRAALNVSNLTDKVYVASCGNRGDCWYGARRNVVGTVSYRW
ncbi:TonB-dependent siderophore receptor [Piscinibacter sp. HJYY11]|nr:TonB-dependent siderophore receptor [Piscinibacter sp. HJYY11]